MRIDGINKVGNIYNKSGVKVEKIYAAKKENDSLNISDFGRELQIAKKAVGNTPDIRRDKVDAIKNQIASGAYNVSVEEVANKIIESYFDLKI
ncbi:FlgM family anti-sigma-28 factor [Natranaerovirga pectinivora]|uniref:Negative regulator of flagellin synthesis n=1 Tax=Natranaerovirga pectinivora TaxID=682400 RepID=A0A4R3MN41_9FIRM|nr:flagellar biosynthesis anti-sigma factor FlgM [Natranaerovirga pectinivora]TCT14012.1 FlgM family anti-sigma-28 factor [Natranaerovirga pectinivora]